MKLYELASQYRGLMGELYDQETGEVNEVALSLLNDLKAPLDEKCINVSKAYQNLESERKAIAEAKKAMTKREHALKKQSSDLLLYLKTNMQASGITEIKCPYFVIKLRQNPPKVHIEDESMIPKRYEKVYIDYDIAQMRSELLNGIKIPGVSLCADQKVTIK